MILSKQYLNELTQKKALDESVVYFSKRKKEEREDYDIFFSYSYNDKEFALTIVQLLEKCGYNVYIDLKDNELDRNNVGIETVKKIAQSMDKCRGLLYLYSKASSVSRWCPWELGYVSGKKSFRCAKLPLIQSSKDTYEKQEYLEIYPTIEYAKVSGTEKNEFWVYESAKKYTTLRKWINGEEPQERK